MKTSRVFVGLCVTTVLVGCAGSRHRVAAASSSELSAHPTLIFQTVDHATLKLNGVRLNDPASSVKPDAENASSQPDWIINHAGNRFRIADGRVVTLGLWDSSALAKLDLNSPADIERVFGRADSVDASTHFYGGTFKVFRYASKKMSVIWNEMEDRVVGINLE